MKQLEHIATEFKEGATFLKHDIYLAVGTGITLYARTGVKFSNNTPIIRNLSLGHIYATPIDFKKYYKKDEEQK